MYIELLVIKDLLVNYVILFTAGYILNRKIVFRKIFLSSVIGSIDLIFLCLNINNVYAITFILSLVMSYISYGYNNLLYFIKNIFYMYLTSICYSGFVYIINFYFFSNISSDLIYTLILLIFVPIISFIYSKSIKNIVINNHKYYNVCIYLYGQDIIKCISFLDTGNKLIDPYSHKPIILLNKCLVKEDNLKKLLVPYNTVNNHNLLECIIPDKIYIEEVGYKKRFLIGLVDDINIEGAMCILNEKLL